MSLFRRPASGVPAGDAIPSRHGDVTHLCYLSSPPDTTDDPRRVRTTRRPAGGRGAARVTLRSTGLASSSTRTARSPGEEPRASDDAWG